MAGWLTATLAMTIAGRELAAVMSVYQIMILRCLIAVAILTPIVMMNGGLVGRLTQLRWHLVRNIFHYAGQFMWFSALIMVPLAEVIAIEFSMPVWIAVLAAAFLGERLYGAKIAALIFGIAGVAMIAKPGLVVQSGHIVALGSALLFSCSVVLTKFITRKDTALTVIFLMFSIQTVMGAIPAYVHWVPIASESYRWVAVLGLSGTVSHYCLSKAISLADATMVMPMDFLRLPLTALLGYVLYSEGIDQWSVLGALMILAANALNLVKVRKT